jgi:hypothetical protein
VTHKGVTLGHVCMYVAFIVVTMNNIFFALDTLCRRMEDDVACTGADKRLSDTDCNGMKLNYHLSPSRYCFRQRAGLLKISFSVSSWR